MNEAPAVLFAMIAVNGTIQSVTGPWRDLLGWEPRELLGKTFIELVHPDDLDMVVTAIHRLYAGQGKMLFRCRTACRDGMYMDVGWTGDVRLESLEIELHGQPVAA